MRLDSKWTVVGGVLVVGAALLACKKKEEEAAPVASAAPAPEPPKEEPKKDAAPDEKVKRYDDETKESGTVRISLINAKVFKEADTTSELLTTLNRGTLVNRLARRGNFMLIDYPSGPGELSPGWILAAQVSTIVEKVDPEKVKNQPDAGTKPPPKKVDAGAPKPEVKKDAGAPKPEVKKDAGKPAPPVATRRPTKLKIKPR